MSGNQFKGIVMQNSRN